MNKEFKLPELPDSNLEVVHSCAWTKVYTADQMNAHALASVEAYKAMNAVPLAATEVDFATCPTCGEDDILAPVKAGAQSVAVPDDIAADSLLESIASRYSELNDPTEFIRNGWGCAGHEDVLAALKELHTIMLNNIEESQPPAPEQAPYAYGLLEQGCRAPDDCEDYEIVELASGISPDRLKRFQDAGRCIPLYKLDEHAQKAWQAQAALAKGGAR